MTAVILACLLAVPGTGGSVAAAKPRDSATQERQAERQARHAERQEAKAERQARREERRQQRAAAATTETPPATGPGTKGSAQATPAASTTPPAVAAPATPSPAPSTPVVTTPAEATPATPTPAQRRPATSTPAPGDAGGGGGSVTGAVGGVGAASGGAGGSAAGTAGGTPAPSARERRRADGGSPVTRTVVRTVKEVVGVVPGFMWALIAGLGVLLALTAARSGWMVSRTRRLERQRAALLEDVGLLQEALLSPAPEGIAGLAASAAYRPAAGAAAGGAFHEVFRLGDARLGVIVGEVTARGRRALGLTALVRHTLRAYLEAGMAPRLALQAAGDALASQLGADRAAVAVAIHDRDAATLTWATAGLAPPVVLGVPAYAPVTVCAPPALGLGTPGTRQTTLRLPRGAVVCLFTGEMVHGPAVADGAPTGLRGLWRELDGLGEGVEAEALLARVAARTGRARRDMAACVLRVVDPAPAAQAHGADRRVEELELSRRDLDGLHAREFLEACAVPSDAIDAVLAQLRPTGERLGAVVLRVRIGAGPAQADLGLRSIGAVPFARVGSG